MHQYDTATLIDLAEAVDTDGLDAHVAALFQLADQAVEAGVHPVVPQVMLDVTEPWVARVRAFTKASSAVSRRGGVRSDQRTAALV